MDRTGKIVNIQRFTIHDGPGIRTQIFFKGCPLRCMWCSNPECISPKTELGVYPKCIGLSKCGLCVKACPVRISPLGFDDDVLWSIDRAKCSPDCIICVDACPASAVIRWGKEYNVEQLMEIILADMSYYQKSGGGVTLSGGEVMLQWEFARELLRACKESGIHTCVESALHCGREQMKAVYEFTDLVISDIKHMDTGLHKEYTGVGNELILENLKRTIELGKNLVIRIPVVPGHNDDDENILATGEFILKELGGKLVQLQLLPYRKLGVDKYASLGLDYPMGDDYKPPEREFWEPELLRLAALLTDMGVPAVAGSNVKYDA